MAGRNLRPILVLKQGSMTTNQPTSNRIALWLIAVSLVVIAACLVWMAINQNARERLALGESPAVESPVETPSATRPSVTAPSKSRTPAKDRSSSATVRSTAPTAKESTPSIEPSAVQVVSTEPTQNGALLPLATVPPTNGATVITGRVTLAGKPPREHKFEVSDSICGKSGKTLFTTRNYVVSTNGGLSQETV